MNQQTHYSFSITFSGFQSIQSIGIVRRFNLRLWTNACRTAFRLHEW